MQKVKFQITMSLDGFVAGPEQSVEHPLGIGGEGLHEWVVQLEAWRRSHGMEGGVVNASTAVLEEATVNAGAHIMGRNMFGGGPGPWGNEPWMGWWGETPPFHAPVFVVTHYPREPLEMQGGTTFHFVTDGFEGALQRAREASGETDISIGGGAKTVQEYLRAGLIDEGWVHVVPIMLGDGARLFDDLRGLALEQVDVIAGENVTHIKYRSVR